jgi:hypothetical protein
MRLGRSVLVLLMIVLGSIASAYAVPDQPRMQDARANLVAAKASLQRARQNKAGHRAKAIEYINAAIAEVDRGIAYDRHNNHASTSPFVSGEVPPDQPNMQAALNDLNNAKRNLEAATADKGGHRAKAIDYVNDAIREVNAGIAAG